MLDALVRRYLPVVTAFFQIDGDILVSQYPRQTAQTLPGLGVISIEDDETGSAFSVKNMCAQMA